MNTENPDKLIKDAMKIEFFFVSFCNTYFARKKSAIEAKAAIKIIRYRRMVETPLDLIQLKLLRVLWL